MFKKRKKYCNRNNHNFFFFLRISTKITAFEELTIYEVKNLFCSKSYEVGLHLFKTCQNSKTNAYFYKLLEKT